MTKKRIIILDDSSVIPTLIQEFLSEEKEFEISSIVNNSDDFINQLEEHCFDIALIDISVGGREGGLDVLRVLRNRKIDLASVVLSAHEETDYALKSLILGAKGYLSKRYICTDLPFTLKEVSNGQLYVSGPHGSDILKKHSTLHETRQEKATTTI
jgi:two-component system invasion response regulator UvrY